MFAFSIPGTGAAAGRATKAVLLAAALVWQAGSSALAGEVNEVGGVAIKGFDPVAYFVQGRPVAGTAELTVEHQGATYRFATSENREAFRANPSAYAPQYGGFCAFGTAEGYKADIDPAAFTVVSGKLYLNYNKGVQAQWSKNIPDYIAKADTNWPRVSLMTNVYR